MPDDLRFDASLIPALDALNALEPRKAKAAMLAWLEHEHASDTDMRDFCRTFFDALRLMDTTELDADEALEAEDVGGTLLAYGEELAMRGASESGPWADAGAYANDRRHPDQL